MLFATIELQSSGNQIADIYIDDYLKELFVYVMFYYMIVNLINVKYTNLKAMKIEILRAYEL